MPRIIITTGGTGGHIFPALATAEALAKIDPGVDILFVGATYGAEEKLVKKIGISFIGLPGRGILGKGIKAIPALVNNVKAIHLALKIVRDFNPCAIAAFGGYASFPAALAGRMLGFPLLIHEQNAIVGTVNKILGFIANTRCSSLPQMKGWRKPYIYTGNPVRDEIERIKKNNKKGNKRLLILGGSQGAYTLNRYIVSIHKDLFQAGIEILHQTGEKDYKEICQAYEKEGYSSNCVRAFISNMADAYAWADLAFCRSGASTVAELCVTGVPSILVPFPSAIHDHQTLNALALKNAGAAIILQQTELEKAKNIILNLFNNQEKLVEMAQAALLIKRPQAAILVASEIQKLCLGTLSA